MWEFIKYLAYCFFGAMSSAFGNNTEGFTWKDGLVGVIVMFALIAIIGGAVQLVRFLAKRNLYK